MPNGYAHGRQAAPDAARPSDGARRVREVTAFARGIDEVIADAAWSKRRSCLRSSMSIAISASSEDAGLEKITVRASSDCILGATIVARHAGGMINGISVAMVTRVGLPALAGVIHSYPTDTDAIRQAAQAYHRARLTPRVLARLARSLARKFPRRDDQ